MSDRPIISRESAKSIGERIAMLRKEKNMTQAELAKLLGVSRSALAGWEGGFRMPDIDSWFQLALIFDVSTDYICGTSSQRVFKSSSISDKIDLEKLNTQGQDLLFEFYHMLLKKEIFTNKENGK